MGNLIGIILISTFSILNLQAQETESKAKAGDTSQVSRSADYSAKVSEINKLEARIRDQQARMKDLLQSRHNIKDNEKKSAAMDEVKTIHKELNENIQSFNKVTRELRYRFPDEGYLTERKYIQLQEKSIDQIEEEIGLTTDLKRLKARVEKKYKPFAKAEEEKPHATPASILNKPKEEKVEEKPEPRLQLKK